MSLYHRRRGDIAAYAILARIRRERVMADLTTKVLARFAVELAEADTLQLVHLAQRAEARYSSDLGERMRGLVDAERTRRAQHLAGAA